jgi:hypothetical protein
LVFSIEPSLNAASGSTGNQFDVILTNTGPAVTVGAFSFGITTADMDITFTGADTLTTVNPYIFAGDSFDVINSFGLATTSGAQVLEASDLSNSGNGTTLATGQSLSVADVMFDVATAAALGPAEVDFEAFPTTSLSDNMFNNLDFSASSGIINITPPTVIPEPKYGGLLAAALIGLAVVLKRRVQIMLAV